MLQTHLLYVSSNETSYEPWFVHHESVDGEFEESEEVDSVVDWLEKKFAGDDSVILFRLSAPSIRSLEVWVVYQVGD